MALAVFKTDTLVKYRAIRLAIAERTQKTLDTALWDDPTQGYWTDTQVDALRISVAANWQRMQEIDAIIGAKE